MLSVEVCREHLGNIDLSDEQVEEFRDALYALVDNLLDDYIESVITINSPCKKHLFTVESRAKDSLPKVTG